MGVRKITVPVVLLLIFVGFITTDAHSNTRRTFIIVKNLEKIDNVHQYTNTSLTLSQNRNDTITRWSSWSKCESCQQHRVIITLKPNSNIKIEEVQRKPCKQRYCLRQWHKHSGSRRMSIVSIYKKRGSKTKSHKRKKPDEKHLKKHVNKDPKKTKNPKKEIWSKWSAWTKCNNSSCKTHRYKVCSKPGRCLKAKKYETAYCFHPHTYCERYIKYMLNLLEDEKPIKRANIVTTTTTTTTTRAPVRKPKRKQFCGRPLRKHSMLRIKGGRNANRNMWPWHVAVVNERNEVFCSGTLIAPRWVLTAGHCVKQQMKVRINEYDLTQSDGEIEIPIVWSKRHQKFNTLNIDNDIGLLYLQHGVKTPVACLPTTQPHTNDTCTILGWGALNSHFEIGHPILQEAKIPIVENHICKSAYRQYFISRNMFCAGLTSGEIDTCAGDSGGGLMCKHRMHRGTRAYNAYTVQGITSFGEGCGKRYRYGIYTNVANYIDWINRTMNDPEKRNRTEYNRSRNRQRDAWNGDFYSYQKQLNFTN